MSFFPSCLGTFAVQSLLHSIVAMLLVEAGLAVWQLDRPLARFRFRLLVLVLPLVTLPLFQLVSPDRGGFYFRQDIALFDAELWWTLGLPGGVSLGPVAVGLVAVGSGGLFVFQELLPMVRDLLARRVEVEDGDEDEDDARDPEVEHAVHELAELAGVRRPDLTFLTNEEPIIATAGTRTPRIVVSRGLLRMLDRDELRVALAHELAHVVRRSTIVTIGVFLIRVLMFYNPVTLVVFRQLVYDDEQICDDITVRLTGAPQTLAGVLQRFMTQRTGAQANATSFRELVEDRSHDLLLRDRIARLKRWANDNGRPFPWAELLLTATAVLAVCYFVV